MIIVTNHESIFPLIQLQPTTRTEAGAGTPAKGGRRFKVLFVYPNLRGMNMLPPAIAILAALLEQDGVEVDLFDTTHWIVPGEEDFDSDKVKEKYLAVRPYDFAEHQVSLHRTNVFEDFEKKVQSFSPDLIAVSSTEDIFPVAIKLLAHIRRHRIPTLLGGVFGTFAPGLALTYDVIDMVCVGEGEQCLVDLCRRMASGRSYDDVTNLWIRKPGGQIIRNGVTSPVDMNSNPLPKLDIFEEARLYRPMAGTVYRMMPVETHRGCPYTCAFCNSPSQNELYRESTGKSYFRKKSLESVYKEVTFYRDTWKAEYLYFWADTFLAFSDSEFDGFCEMYKDVGLPFWIQTRPETLSETRIGKLKEVGLHRVALGIEHGNEKFRRDIVDRRISNARLIESFKILNRFDVPFSVNNIVGFPTETYELAMDTVELNRHVNADNHNCYSFSPFHGTPLRALSEKLGYITPGTIVRSLTAESVLNMPQFSNVQIEGLKRCFNLYVKFPKERWPEIKQAESFTPEGDVVFERLRAEFVDQFFAPKPADDLSQERV